MAFFVSRNESSDRLLALGILTTLTAVSAMWVFAQDDEDGDDGVTGAWACSTPPKPSLSASGGWLVINASWSRVTHTEHSIGYDFDW